MEQETILNNLEQAVIEGDKEKMSQNTRAVLEQGIDPLLAVEAGISRGMEVVGKRFESGEAYLPELLKAADIFNFAMADLQPAIEAQQSEIKKTGTVLLATVKGDVHNLGKNIVATVLSTNGFNVIDIGVDQATLDIIDAAQHHRADIIGLSAVMTTTMPAQKEVIDSLSELKLRDQFAVLVGGGPISQRWADEIGADGYCETAMDGVSIARDLIHSRS